MSTPHISCWQGSRPKKQTNNPHQNGPPLVNTVATVEHPGNSIDPLTKQTVKEGSRCLWAPLSAADRDGSSGSATRFSIWELLQPIKINCVMLSWERGAEGTADGKHTREWRLTEHYAREGLQHPCSGRDKVGERVPLPPDPPAPVALNPPPISTLLSPCFLPPSDITQPLFRESGMSIFAENPCV